MQRLPILAGLSAAEQERLIALGQQFMASKRFSTIGDDNGLEATTCILVSLMAALPVLHLSLAHYATFYEVRLYRDEFPSLPGAMDSNGVVHDDVEWLAGEAWEQGPVLLSMPDLQHSGDWTGFNLVIHELAHKLDMASGEINGCPPMAFAQLANWQHQLTQAFSLFQQQVEHAEQNNLCLQGLPMDPYGLESDDEFFAVSCEAFFTRPRPLRDALPDWYQQLALYFRQDPIQRAPTAT
ncbi:zinc-dependent peptidase [Ferrimonas pelagia]|uniref:Zinc-dependent peptidase n=1 Tax=Ferrimonas pelagia TaxID=1177826 RepID=A0ABP9FJ29_9GAMM